MLRSVLTVKEVFHTDDAEFSKVFLDDRIIRESDPLLVYFSVAALLNRVRCQDYYTEFIRVYLVD